MRPSCLRIRLLQVLPQARASSQGQVRGVQHQKIYAGKLRDQARLADKKRRWHNDDWQTAHRRRSIRARDTEWWSRKSAQLQQEADRLWAEANEESRKAGHPHKGRDGEEVAYETPRLGTFEQSWNILVERIANGQVTWPPGL